MNEELKKDQPLHRERLNLENKEDQQKLLQAKRKQLTRDMALCFNSPAGSRVLRHLMLICGYKKSKVGGNVNLGMDVEQGTLYNSARENVCIEFLEFVPVYIIKNVEYGTLDELEE